MVNDYWEQSLSTALAIGLKISEYNEMTPHELSLAIHAYNAKLQYEEEQRIIQSYLTAYWQRVNKLKPLKKIMAELTGAGTNNQQMSAKQMLEEVKRLNAQFGGDVIYGK